MKRCADARADIQKAVEAYAADIRARAYPAAEHCYAMEPGEAAKLAVAKPRRTSP